MTCLDENRVVEFIQGLLSPEARATIETHLDECASCRHLMAEVARLSFAAGSSRRALPAEEPGVASLLTPTGSKEVLPEQVLAGRFRIIRRLGRGSFGNVYEAEDLQLHERVALKLLRPEVRDNPGLLGHLHHEIVVGRRVSHPNVCRIYDLGTCDDLHFISMALIPGEGLDRLLEKGLPGVERARSMLMQICEALEAAHHQGVVHRDLKPSNIMVRDEADGVVAVTVMDFGLSRDLRAGPSMSGALIGSPAYWSPEQARGDRATAHSDLYSLGLIGCDLFGVKHPAFGAVTGLEAVPAVYRAVLERCLRARPEERFASAREVRIALVMAGKHAHLRRRRLRTLLVIGLAAAVGGVASVLVVGLLPRAPAPRPGGFDRGPLLATHSARPDARADLGGTAARRRDASNARMVKVVKLGQRATRKPLPAVVAEPPQLEAPAPAHDAGVPSKAPARAPVTAALGERLARFEAERRERGVLIDDLPSGRAHRDTARRALAAGNEGPALAALVELERSLRGITIDGTFVSRKLQGLNRAKHTVHLPEAAEKKMAAIFARVHERFFSGDFRGANAELNRIWHLLGRGD